MSELTIVAAQSRVLTLPGRPRFMLDADLAQFYGTETRYITRQVDRNPDRFPEDFAFEITEGEAAILRCQNGTSSGTSGHGGRRYLPLAFTQAGALALSGVLKTPRAAEVSVIVFRAFGDLRTELALLKRFNRNLSTQLLVAKPLWNKIMRLHEAGYHWYSIKCQLGRGEGEYQRIAEAMEDCGLLPSAPGIRAGDPDRQTGLAVAEQMRGEAGHAQI